MIWPATSSNWSMRRACPWQGWSAHPDLSNPAGYD
jgi:hypothetical protein